MKKKSLGETPKGTPQSCRKPLVSGLKRAVSNGSNKDPRSGKFVRGNSSGRGNPVAKLMYRHRLASMQAVSIESSIKVMRKLEKAALAGEQWAIRLYLERFIGPPQPIDVHERVAALEATIEKLTSGSDEE